MARDSVLEVSRDLQKLIGLRDLITKHARKYNLSPAVIAAIISRETRADERYYKPPVHGGLLGDNGHGCGPTQIDTRAHPEWTTRWIKGEFEVGEAIRKGCEVLAASQKYIHASYNSLNGDALLRAAIAGYNCGPANVVKSLVAGNDVDSRTAGGDYSRDVLARADYLTRQGFGGIWTQG